jgi:ribokinase
VAFLGVYGHVNIDTILLLESLPTPGHTVPALDEFDRLGGTGGNVARAAATLGVPTALASFVGNDFPPQYRSLLEETGIDTTDVRVLEGRTPHVWVMTVPGKESVAVIDQGVQGGPLDKEFPLLDYTMLNSDWLHVTTGAVPMHLAVVREAKRVGKRVVFDPAQELHYRYDDRTFERFLDASAYFICNDVELGHALGKLEYGDPVQLLDHVDGLIVTRGADGVDLYTTEGTVRLPACPVRAEHPPEATGAGDVFRGGVYAALHDGRDMQEALRWGSVASSLFLEADGAAFPRREALEVRLQEWTPSPDA